MAVKLAPNLPRFHAIKNRVNDLYQNCGDAIRSKPAKTVWCTALIFSEMEFLIAELKKLAGGAKAVEDPERFRRIAAFVKRVCEEQAGAIKEGAIVKISAEIFSAMRFLVRAVENVLPNFVDDDVMDDIKKVRLADENTERISLDLTDGIGDPDGDDEEELELLTRPDPKPQQGPMTRSGGHGADAKLVTSIGAGTDDLPGDGPLE